MRQGKTGHGCTDGQNQWNAGSKKNRGQLKISDISFKNHNKENLYLPAAVPSSKPTRKAELYASREDWMASRLRTPVAVFFTRIENTMASTTFHAKPKPSAKPMQPVEDVPSPPLQSHDNHETPLACVRCRTFYDDYINMSDTQLMAIEQNTKEQSQQQLWHDMRKVRITASTAKRVPVRHTTNPDKFLSGHLHPTFLGNTATRHGIASEELARQYLQEKGHSIESKGLVLCPGQPWLAASPDGIMDADTLLEIKSPVVGKNKTFREDLARNSDINLVNTEYQLARNGSRGYYMQVQIGMHCTGLGKATLLLWSRSDNVQLPVPFDRNFAEQNVARLRTFYFAHMLPRIVDEFAHGRLQLCPAYHTIVKSPGSSEM